ncbi:hypothetical protein ACLBWX_19850 [Methylobacterium sp. M6A4_1b]
MAAFPRADLLNSKKAAHLKVVVMVFVAECGGAKLYSGIGTVDIETAKMLVGAVLMVAIGAFSVLSLGWMVRDMVADLRAGRANLRDETVSEPR